MPTPPEIEAKLCPCCGRKIEEMTSEIKQSMRKFWDQILRLEDNNKELRSKVAKIE